MGTCESILVDKNSGKVTPIDANSNENSEKSLSFDSLKPKKSLNLSERQKYLIKKHWTTLAEQKADICYETMKKWSEMSTSFTEVFIKPECKYIIKSNIEEYSRINELCNAQLKCFQKLIIENDVNLHKIEQEADRLGRTHRRYSSIGMKPHFMDLYQSNFLLFLQNLNIENIHEKEELFEAWKTLMNFVVDRMYAIYAEGNPATKEDFERTNMIID